MQFTLYKTSYKHSKHKQIMTHISYYILAQLTFSCLQHHICISISTLDPFHYYYQILMQKWVLSDYELSHSVDSKNIGFFQCCSSVYTGYRVQVSKVIKYIITILIIQNYRYPYHYFTEFTHFFLLLTMSNSLRPDTLINKFAFPKQISATCTERINLSIDQ